MFIFCTDIDGTIYQKDEHAELFRGFWEDLRKEGELGGNRPLLVFNTGRSLENCRQLLKDVALPMPDYIIGGVGTEIYDVSKDEKLVLWDEKLRENWSFEKVTSLVEKVAEGIEAQPPECQNEFKSSWFWHEKLADELNDVKGALEAAGMEAQVIYSSNRDLDVIPKLANKGNAISWLMEKLGLDMANLVVAGDSGNDVSMFQLEGVRGILPMNSEHILRDQIDFDRVFDSPGVCAEGVVHGLRTSILKKVKS